MLLATTYAVRSAVAHYTLGIRSDMDRIDGHNSFYFASSIGAVMQRSFFLASLGAVTLAGCSHGPAQKFATLSDDLQPLRNDFNRESGKTRVVMLLSPT